MKTAAYAHVSLSLAHRTHPPPAAPLPPPTYPTSSGRFSFARPCRGAFARPE